MSDKTGIEWTDATWNPIAGCNDVSPGCTNCYARLLARRLAAMELGAAKKYPDRVPRTKYQGLTVLQGSHVVWTGKINFDEAALLEPLGETKPTKYFVNSMSDLFHENVTDEMLDRIFAVMALCPQHTFQVLTKRPERMLKYLTAKDRWMGIYHWADDAWLKLHPKGDVKKIAGWPLPNVQLGVSVENQKAADERIPLLLQTPAAVRFLSCEPLLGAIDLGVLLGTQRWIHRDTEPFKSQPDDYDKAIDWVIVGGESGPWARPMHPDWARSLRDQCVAAGVPFFFKQWGEWRPARRGDPDFIDWNKGGFRHDGSTVQWSDDENEPEWSIRVGKKAAGALLDGREWREFPAVRP